MNKKAVDQLCEAVATLRANHFEILSEARVFCAVAAATLDGALSKVTEISRVTRLPLSTVSRLILDMSKRGLLEYTTDSKDRRRRLVRAKLEAFK